MKLRNVATLPMVNGLEGHLGKQDDDGRWVVHIEQSQEMNDESREDCEKLENKYQISVGEDKFRPAPVHPHHPYNAIVTINTNQI